MVIGRAAVMAIARCAHIHLHIINQCGGDGLFDTGCAVEVASAGRMGDQQPRRDETRLDPIFDVFTVADDEA